MTWLRLAVLALFALLLVLAPPPDENYLFERAVAGLSDRIAASLEGAEVGAVELSIAGAGAKAIARGEQELLDLLRERGASIVSGGPVLRVSIERAERSGRALWRLGEGAEQGAASRFIGVSSLVPPLAAILIALLFQRVLIALSIGVWLGATLLSGGNPIAGLWIFFRTYLVQEALLDSFRIEIIGFVIGLVALVGILSRGGGMQGMIGLLMRFVHSARSAQLAAFAMGILIFFDDYANTILVGGTMRPLTDRFRVSREKLSFLVDATAAPVAALSLLSTWIAYEVSQFAPQILEVGITENPYLVFLRTLPFRFYSIFLLLFILASILLGRDYGPMLAAEKRARTKGEVIRPGARPMIADDMTRIGPKEGVPARWWNGVIPIVTVVVVTLAGLWVTGSRALEPRPSLAGIFSVDVLRRVLEASSSTKAIAWGAWSGFFLAAAFFLAQRILNPREIAQAAFRSARALSFAILILLLAWCIGGVCRDMGTAHYLVALFRRSLSPEAYPAILFVLSCAVSFSTGSSWSTMAIVLPNSVTLAYLIGESSALGPFGTTVLSIGAVLEGSIFGDHCSPISDTTILSSVSSASNHLDHVRTQMPYALTVAVVALGCGYVPAAFGLPSAAAFGLGMAALLAALFWIGKRVPDRATQGR
ncbi:MAG: Na+/H+ antiporter NhaC family protein [Candidatus Latescibacterota bacterium]|nr:MAG: Na+/H+ antiporter NhaC family protein [Candidatus Latescibacterota bacterium]